MLFNLHIYNEWDELAWTALMLDYSDVLSTTYMWAHLHTTSMFCLGLMILNGQPLTKSMMSRRKKMIPRHNLSNRLNRVTLVTLTEYFRNHCLQSISQKNMFLKVSQFPCKFHWHSQWLHLNNLFYKTSTLTPFVKLRQVLSYLDVAIAKKSWNLHAILCKFCNFLSVKLAKIGHKNIWSV